MNKKILASAALLIIVIVGIFFAVRQNSTTTSNNDKLQVIASYYPLYDFVKSVGKDKVSVINMTPAGSEPHDYEPSAKALAEAQTTPVFVYNGGHMEPWTEGFLHDYKNTAVKASNSINLLSAEAKDNPAKTIQDPHFWLDPVLAKKIVDNIRDGLSKADPTNKEFYTKNADSYKAQLVILDAAYRNGLSQCSLRTVISSHDAFSYLAKRYNLNVVSIAGLSPEEEPSAAKLAELSQLIKDKGIHYVFFESLVSPRLADTIAAETGARTLVFDPIEGLTDADQKEGKNYLSIQRENLDNLRTALACK
jgi:zinc transport system substrate-binding protein